MKYILKLTNGECSLLRTIEEVITDIVNESNGSYSEKDGLLYKNNDMLNSISVMDAVSDLNMKLIKILDLLTKNYLSYNDVRNIHLENDKVMVVATPKGTVKIEFN